MDKVERVGVEIWVNGGTEVERRQKEGKRHRYLSLPKVLGASLAFSFRPTLLDVTSTHDVPPSSGRGGSELTPVVKATPGRSFHESGCRDTE